MASKCTDVVFTLSLSSAGQSNKTTSKVLWNEIRTGRDYSAIRIIAKQT